MRFPSALKTATHRNPAIGLKKTFPKGYSICLYGVVLLNSVRRNCLTLGLISFHT